MNVAGPETCLRKWRGLPLVDFVDGVKSFFGLKLGGDQKFGFLGSGVDGKIGGFDTFRE